MNKIDQGVLQGITTALVLLATVDDQAISFFTNLLPGAKIVIPIGLLVFIYRFLVYLYDRLIWPFIHRDNFVGGQWIYKLHNHKSDKHLYGVFTIAQGIEGVTVKSGEVWFQGVEPIFDNQRGSWKSKSAIVQNLEFQFFFEMKTIAKEEIAGTGKITQGVFLLDLIEIDGKIEKMNGQFYDHHERIGNLGVVEAKKIAKTTRVKHLKSAYFEYGRT